MVSTTEESYFDRSVFRGLKQLCDRTPPGGFQTRAIENIVPQLEMLSEQVAASEREFLQSYSNLAVVPSSSNGTEEKQAFVQFSRTALALKKAQIEVLELKLSFYEKFYCC